MMKPLNSQYMKKQILVLVFSLVCYTLSFGQQKEEAEKLVEEGIAYHDKGDFEGAIAKYDKALELDKDNLLALAEKAMSLLSLEKHEDAIKVCKTAIKKHPGEKGLGSVYVTCGTAYDGLKKTDKSIETYDEGINLFPNFYQLHFNKGITLISVRKYDDAILCFQKSAALNPKHASSHNAIGRLLNMKGKRVPALLAYSRFLIVEPESKRAEENLAGLQKILKGNAKQTDKNSISISISPDMLADTTADGKPQENSFTSTDLILTLGSALDFQNKEKSEVKQAIRKFETIFESLRETQKDNSGFYWSYYVPYFIEMKDKNFLETFAYIAFATSDDPAVAKWIKSHKNDIDKFYEWSGNFTWKSN